jgi:hypothetical protein
VCLDSKADVSLNRIRHRTQTNDMNASQSAKNLSSFSRCVFCAVCLDGIP